ncbi:MAG TPA: T9SS type A sorting domain-containing protein [Candidatus Kapabacteria bacterium]|jgi:hypothetical protein|nr:T9SS type A sorting domain-containing protein [Candidatus Kapabacteria bacterium]
MPSQKYLILILFVLFSISFIQPIESYAQQFPEKKFNWQRITFEDSTWYGPTMEMKAVKTTNNLLVIGGQTLYGGFKRPVSISSDFGKTWKRYDFNTIVNFIVDSKNRLVIYGDYDSLSQLLHIIDLNSFQEQILHVQTTFPIKQLIEISEDNYVAKALDYINTYLYLINYKNLTTTQILPRDDTAGVYSKLKYVDNLFKGSKPNRICVVDGYYPGGIYYTDDLFNTVHQFLTDSNLTGQRTIWEINYDSGVWLWGAYSFDAYNLTSVNLWRIKDESGKKDLILQDLYPPLNYSSPFTLYAASNVNYIFVLNGANHIVYNNEQDSLFYSDDYGDTFYSVPMPPIAHIKYALTPSVSYDGNPLIILSYGDSAGVHFESELYIGYQDTTSINTLNDNLNFTISPNPARDYIIVNSNYNINSSEKCQYNIINFLGQNVQSGELKNNRISITELPTGIYFIILRLPYSINSNRLLPLKFVKE